MTHQLETERLILRVHQKDDIVERAALWRHPDVIRYIGNFARTTEEAWERMLFLIGHWQINGYGYWAVESKESRKMIGEIGFMDAKREIDLPFDNSFEAGWVIHPHFHGQGIAYEAMTAAQTWLDDHFSKPHSFCMIHPENAASIGFAQRLGYHFNTKTEYKGAEVDVLYR